jgi:hypothetical protein
MARRPSILRGFNPKLRQAEQRLETLRTPEGEPIPANTLAELKRDMRRRGSSVTRSGASSRNVLNV